MQELSSSICDCICQKRCWLALYSVQGNEPSPNQGVTMSLSAEQIAKLRERTKEQRHVAAVRRATKLMDHPDPQVRMKGRFQLRKLLCESPE